MRTQSLREDKWLSQSHTSHRWADSGLLPPSSQYHTFSLWCNLTDICLKWLLVTDAVVISGEISSPPLFSVSHRSQPQQPSQPQRTLLQHVAQSQTATQTSVVVKSIPASSPGAITHIMQQVVSLLSLLTFCYCLLPEIRFSFIDYRRGNNWIEEQFFPLWGLSRENELRVLKHWKVIKKQYSWIFCKIGTFEKGGII